ncbi:MAG: hypothetical protein IKZ92_06530 [Muribaculaceae bacterium]|nr:hypothetical protein [Muribaculaceae bacterium]
MKYQVVFEYQSEDSAMSDVYNYSDGQQALDKFAELRDMLEHSIDPTDSSGWKVVDTPDSYTIVSPDKSIGGYVRLLSK